MTKHVALLSQQLFRAAIAITLLSGGCAVWLSSRDTLSPRQEVVFETSDDTWRAGTHIIFGLLSQGITCSIREEETTYNKLLLELT